METIIHSNGSKWAGQDPDPLELTIERLKTLTLVDSLYPYCFNSRKGFIQFFGNFVEESAVFDIETDDPAIVSIFVKLINDNPGYKQNHLRLA